MAAGHARSLNRKKKIMSLLLNLSVMCTKNVIHGSQDMYHKTCTNE